MTEEPRDTVRINVALDKDVHKALRLQSIRDDVTLETLVNRLLRQALGLTPPPGS